MTDTPVVTFSDVEQDIPVAETTSLYESLKSELEKLKLLPTWPGENLVKVTRPTTPPKVKLFNFRNVSSPCPDDGPDVVFLDWRGTTLDVLVHFNETDDELPTFVIEGLLENDSARFGSNSATAAARMIQHLLQYESNLFGTRCFGKNMMVMM